MDGSAADDPGVLGLPDTIETFGNPIDLIHGQKRMRRLHLHSGMASPDRFGQGLALVWTLYYNSADLSDRGLGPGWRHSFDLRLRVALESPQQGAEGLRVEILQADGSRLIFPYDKARGVFAAAFAEWGEIQSFDAGAARRWQWRQPGGRTAHFDAQGRLSAWDSLLGHRLELHYNTLGDLIRIDRRSAAMGAVDAVGAVGATNAVGAVGAMGAVDAAGAVDAVGAAGKAREITASLELGHSPESRRIERAILTRPGGAGAWCTYRYRAGSPGEAPLTEVACSHQSRPGQEAPVYADRRDASGAIPSFAAPGHERYLHEDPRHPASITGVIRSAPTSLRGAQPVDAASSRSIYRYDASGRVVYSQGFGESSEQAIHVAYSAGERQLRRGVEQAVYMLDAGTTANQAFAPRIRPGPGNPEACLWCPGMSAYRLQPERDELGRIRTIRERGSQRLLERRTYSSADRIALPSTIERPSVRPGAFAQSRFTRDRTGLLVAIEHTGFRPLDVDSRGGATAFEALQRTIRLRYRNDGEGLAGAYLSHLGPEELSPTRLQFPLVIPGLQEQGNRWHGVQRWMDDFGRTVLLRDVSGKISRSSFDALDRIAGAQNPFGLHIEHRWDAESRPLSVRYEGSGRTQYQWQRLPGGDSVLREATSQGEDPEAPRMRIQWTYDADGRIASRSHQIGSRTYRWRIARDPSGRVSKEHLPDGGTLLYHYDSLGLLSLRYRQGDLFGVELYRRLSPEEGASPTEIRYQLGPQEVRWKPLPTDPSKLLRLEVGSLAAWALRNPPLASASLERPAASPQSPGAVAGEASATSAANWSPSSSDRSTAGAAWSYDAASRWLGDGTASSAPAAGRLTQLPRGQADRGGSENRVTRALRMHYDPLGMPAMLSSGGSGGQQLVMDGWRPLLFASREGVLRGLVVWVGSLPVAWIQSGRVYHLAVDWRGAPTHAFTPAGTVVWRADYLQPLLPKIESRTLRRVMNGRSLPRKSIPDQVQIPLGVAGRWMPDTRLVDEDPRLAPLLFGAFRVLDATTGRFLQADPLGPAGGRDPFAYADSRPWQYVDPWGLARLTYFAILQAERSPRGASASAGSTGGAPSVTPPTAPSHQGFAIGRWSFLLESIAPSSKAAEASAGTLSALQNSYARHQQSLLFDAHGSFRLSQQDPLLGTWFANDTLRFDASDSPQILSSFRDHYGAALITRSAFVVEDFDDRQATRLMALLSRDQAARTQCLSPSRLWLPPLSLGDRNAPIQPDAPQGQGASVQRLLACDGALAGIPEPLLQSLYSDPLEGSRVERLQAAAQLQEAPAPSSITPVCSSDGCRTRTAIEVNARKYYASYGSTQFVLETFLRTLRRDVLSAGSLDPRSLGWLGLDQSVPDAQGRPVPIRQWIDQGIARAGATARAFDDVRNRFGRGLGEAEALRHWQSLTSAQQQQWILSTGLDSRAFVDMLGFLPDGRARTEAEARNAFAAEAVLRLGQAVSAHGSFGNWLLGFFSDSARFGFVSRLFLRNHLRKVLAEPRLQGLLGGTGPAGPNTPRSLSVEAEIAYRVALMHNGGEAAPGALEPAKSPPPYLRQYAEEFMRRAGRGNWEALRCLDHLEVAGLQMQTLRFA